MDTSQSSLFPSAPTPIHPALFGLACVIDSKGICERLVSLNPVFFPGVVNPQGKNIADFFPANIGKCLPEMILTTLDEMRPQGMEFALTDMASGEEHWFVARCLHLPSPPEEGVRLVWYCLDDTANKVRETQVYMYQDHLEEMIDIRTEEQRRTNKKLQQEIVLHKKTTEDLERVRERYYLAIQGSRDGIWDWDLTDDSIYLSAQWKEMLGFEDDELSNTVWTWLERVQEDDCLRLTHALGQLIHNKEPNCAIECRMYHKDGTFRWIFVKAAVLRDSQGKVLRMAGTCTDITERKHADNVSSMLLQITNALNTTLDLDELYASIHQVLLTFIGAKNFYIALLDKENDRLFFPYFKDETEEMLPPVENFSEQTDGNTRLVIQTGQTMVLDEEEQRAAGGRGTPAKIWIALPLKSRDTVIGAMVVQHYTLPDHDTSRDVELLEAVSTQIALVIERKSNETLLSHLALHDSLTGLPNRTLLRERLGQALRRSQRTRAYYFAVAMIDLDRFKFVNDCHGHLLGDELLQELASRLRGALRSIDTLARLGGDEFFILFEEIENVHKLVHKVKELQKVIRQPFRIKGYDIQVDSSIGLIVETGTYLTADELLRDVDTAMYQAKKMGRGKMRVFSKKMRHQAMKNITLEQDLRQALDKEEFSLEYQPVINFSTLDIEGFEALIRWQHPVHGFISPGEFIPIAEDIGIIRDIGLWVLEHACTTLRAWHRDIPQAKHITMAVNLSAKQLNSQNLPLKISEILDDTGMLPSALNMEITETAIMEAPDRALETLKQLKNFGMGVALDDFGTGYSSLSYLHTFPSDTIKIDRSFVSVLVSDKESLEIVRAIVVLGNSLGLKVIAEGIETWRQYDILRSFGCAQAQGFLFSRPLKEVQCRELLEQPEMLPWKQMSPVAQ